jgi:Tfp pilus tip-associated adhesin PilY1
MAKWLCKDVVLGLLAVGFLSGALCDDQKTTSQTEVKDRLLGGKEVKQTEVTEQGDKTQVRETKTKTKSDGTLEKRETSVKGDDIN